MVVVNLASEVGATAVNAEDPDAAGLFSQAGVGVGFRRDSRVWRFPGVFMADRLSKGDLKGFKETFPLMFET